MTYSLFAAVLLFISNGQCCYVLDHFGGIKQVIILMQSVVVILAVKWIKYAASYSGPDRAPLRPIAGCAVNLGRYRSSVRARVLDGSTVSTKRINNIIDIFPKRGPNSKFRSNSFLVYG